MFDELLAKVDFFNIHDLKKIFFDVRNHPLLLPNLDGFPQKLKICVQGYLNKKCEC